MRWDRVAMVIGGLGLLAVAWLGMRPGEPEVSGQPAVDPAPRPTAKPRPLVFMRPEDEQENVDPTPFLGELGEEVPLDTGVEEARPERDWEELSDLPPELRQEVLDGAHAALAEVMRQCAPEMSTSADGVLAQTMMEIDGEGLAEVRFGSQSLSHPRPGMQNAFPADFSDCAEATLWDQEWPRWDGKLKVLLYAPVEPDDGGVAP